MVNATRLYRIGTQWLPLISWTAVIFFVSHQPSQNIPIFGFWDLLVKKGAHFIAYLILAELAFGATNQKRPAYALLITLLYAISDEWHQTFIPGRNGTLIDVLIDFSGGVTALFIHYRWKRR